MGLFGNFFGGGAKINYQPPQNIQNFMQPVPVTDMQKTDFYGRLVSDKQGYDTAQKSIDLIQQALQTPELSEASKNNWRRKMKGYEEARDAYAQDANSVRQSAASLGLDVSDYDANKSLQESAQAFQNYKTNAVKDFLNLPSMADLEENRYMELRSQGASPGQANRILNRERGKMRDQLSRRYTDAMATYGTNPDGSLDQNIGMQLLRGLKEVDPATAQIFYGGFATPQKVYDANNDLKKLSVQSGMLDRKLAQQAAIEQAREIARRENLLLTLDARKTIEDFLEKGRNARNDADNMTRANIALLNNEGANYRSDSTNQTKIDIANQADQTRRAIEELRDKTKREIEDMKITLNSPAGKFMQYYKLAYELNGGDEVEARRLAMREVFKGDDKDKSKTQGVFNIIDTMFSLIEQGKEDEAGEMLEILDADAKEKQSEFYAQFADESQSRKYNNLVSAFKEYLDLDSEKLGKDNMQDAKDKLIAKYRAAQRGTDWAEEYTALRQARSVGRHNIYHKDKPADDGITNENEKVRDLLGNGIAKPQETKDNKTNGGSIPSWQAPPTPDNFFDMRYYNNR